LIQDNKYSPDLEHKLVFTALSLNRLKDNRLIEMLEYPMDWSLVLQIAIQNGVFPLVYQRIMAFVGKQMPLEEIARWKTLYQVNTQNNFRLTWKLIELIKLLINNDVECIVLKGPIYSLQVYGDIALRQFLDLDVLIHQTDFLNVDKILEQHGYVPSIKLDSRQKKFQLRSDNYFLYTFKGDSFEIHWDISHPWSLSLFTQQQVWSNILPITILDQEVYTLSPEDTILYICLHGAKHAWSQLKWVADLAYLSQSYNEWFPLLEHAKQFGLYRQVCLGLLLAVEVVDTEIPINVLDRVKSNHSARKLASQVLANISKLPNNRSHISDYIFYWKSLDRWQDRIRYIISIIFIPEVPDWKKISLPENMYPAYYFLRPLRLMYKYIKSIIPIKS
jgi:hypothetical protein